MTKITIDLPENAFALLAREAEACGLTLEALASQALRAWAGDDTLDWAEDVRRLEEPGEDIPSDHVFDPLTAEVMAKNAKSL